MTSKLFDIDQGPSKAFRYRFYVNVTLWPSVTGSTSCSQSEYIAAHCTSPFFADVQSKTTSRFKWRTVKFPPANCQLRQKTTWEVSTCVRMRKTDNEWSYLCLWPWCINLGFEFAGRTRVDLLELEFSKGLWELLNTTYVQLVQFSSDSRHVLAMSRTHSLQHGIDDAVLIRIEVGGKVGHIHLRRLAIFLIQNFFLAPTECCCFAGLEECHKVCLGFVVVWQRERHLCTNLGIRSVITNTNCFDAILVGCIDESQLSSDSKGAVVSLCG